MLVERGVCCYRQVSAGTDRCVQVQRQVCAVTDRCVLVQTGVCCSEVALDFFVVCHFD